MHGLRGEHTVTMKIAERCLTFEHRTVHLDGRDMTIGEREVEEVRS
jgi:hypothetical protein